MGIIIAIVLSLIVSVFALTILPRFLKKFGAKPAPHTGLLIIGLVLYVVSWWLPSPLIEGRDTSFTTHLVGGGLFTGFIWLYIKKSFGWKTHWLLEVLSLFALVSALGVVNELFELILYITRVLETIADTSWDLLANTFGALLFYLIYRVWGYGRRH